MKKKKKRSVAVAITLSYLAMLALVLLDLVILFAVKDMMMYLLASALAGAVMLFVLRISLYNICKNSNYCYPERLPYIAHSLISSIVCPLVSTLCGWTSFGDPGEYGMGTMVAGNLIIAMMITAIVGAGQYFLIEYICSDLIGLDLDSYDPSAISPVSCSGSSSSSYTREDSDTDFVPVSLSKDNPISYSGEMEPGGPITISKAEHEALDDLSGSFYGTNT